MATSAKASSLEEERRQMEGRATRAWEVSGSEGNGGGVRIHVILAPTQKAHLGLFLSSSKRRLLLREAGWKEANFVNQNFRDEIRA